VCQEHISMKKSFIPVILCIWLSLLCGFISFSFNVIIHLVKEDNILYWFLEILNQCCPMSINISEKFY